jgi:hypothetical protein
MEMDAGKYVFSNDTVVGLDRQVQEIDNQYKDFKFITQKTGEWEGPQLRDVSFVSAGWNFMVLFVVMVVVVLNKFFAPGRFASIMAMPFQNGGNEKIIRENHSFFNIISLSNFAAFVLMLSMFVQKIYVIYGGNDILHDNISFMFDVAAVVAAIFVFNYLITAFYSWLYKADALLHIHVNLHISIMTTANVVLIPFMMVLLFYPYKFLCTIILVVLLMLFMVRFVKLLIEARMFSKLNFVNIFLYLCTVEILPVLIVFKMVLMAI